MRLRTEISTGSLPAGSVVLRLRPTRATDQRCLSLTLERHGKSPLTAWTRVPG